jgi:Ca-activated chloride channel family protein
VVPIGETLTAVRNGLAGWSGLDLSRLLYLESANARLALVALVGLALAVLLARGVLWARPGHGRIALPALPARIGRSPGALLRHGALALASAGLPFLALAAADPRTPITHDDVTYPGRRISLMIDASSSMLSSFESKTLAKNAPNDAAFFTTVGAAEYFIRMRMAGQYRDLIALVEFGDQAYVITPFTTDYENILLSASLIGDWNEFMAFPDQGTMIARAIDQSVGLFEAFKFLDASGNAMVIFSDGADAEVMQDGRSAIDVLREASRADIPVYFIRTGAGDDLGAGVSDAAWRAAVERTGGKFYSAADEATLIRAIEDIDKLSAGRIEVRQYATAEPRYLPFALVACGLFAAAILLRLSVPLFQTFP